MNDEILTKWNKRPLIISGPCSAETEEQMIETATKLAATGKVDVLRAGIWKPRTKPGLFEGIGTKGLPWLEAAKLQLRFVDGVIVQELGLAANSPFGLI